MRFVAESDYHIAPNFRGTKLLIFADWPFTNFAEIIIFADCGFWLVTPGRRRAQLYSAADVRAHSIVRSCCDTVTLDLTTATTKGSLLVPLFTDTR